MDLTNAYTILQDAIGVVTPAAQLVVRWRGDIVCSEAFGWLDPETRARPTQRDTLFDMASVSKLFTVTAFMTLVEEGCVALDTPVSVVLPEFSGLRPVQPYEDPLSPNGMVSVAESSGFVDASHITFYDLLTHTSGLPAWRPLYREPSAEAARQMALNTFFSYPTGTQVVYSDIGLILLGMAIERLTGHSLDAAVRNRVTAPLELQNTRYLPFPSVESVQSVDKNIAPTEFCAWRNRRIAGAVHDENAYRLGGVAGHAGVFSTAEDIAAFGQTFLDRPTGQRRGFPLLLSSTVDAMTRCYTDGIGTRRGLGFALWLDDPEASSNPFSQRAFGHTGFTGTCLWMDPERDLVVALLTNEVYNGRQDRGIAGLRVAVHRAIVEAVDLRAK
ncbi:MAG TPA: serine hydrolase domain-containing protein [Anaerolineae bacterium]|nr:serine hydrolase domain-containing protein [Anaerolineae bacterium]HQI83276.1 serine hydrolase domain-containing protein [Anaerolineae bacterium]